MDWGVGLMLVSAIIFCAMIWSARNESKPMREHLKRRVEEERRKDDEHRAYCHNLETAERESLVNQLYSNAVRINGLIGINSESCPLSCNDQGFRAEVDEYITSYKKLDCTWDV